MQYTIQSAFCIFTRPSICKCLGQYYLFAALFFSSFSRRSPGERRINLVKFPKSIGHVLPRKSQLLLSGGIYAPTIRYNNGRILQGKIATNVTNGGNFYVHD